MIDIREFRFPEDYENALRLWRDAGEGIGVGPSDQPDEIRKKLEHDPELFLVADDEGQLVGTVIGGFDGRRGLIYHLAVRQDHRQHGLGTRLMDEIEARLRVKGCLKAYLLVKKGNESAIKLYEGRGWNEMDHVLLYGKTLT